MVHKWLLWRVKRAWMVDGEEEQKSNQYDGKQRRMARPAYTPIDGRCVCHIDPHRFNAIAPVTVTIFANRFGDFVRTIKNCSKLKINQKWANVARNARIQWAKFQFKIFLFARVSLIHSRFAGSKKRTKSKILFHKWIHVCVDYCGMQSDFCISCIFYEWKICLFRI